MYGCPKTGVTEAPTVRLQWCKEFTCSAIQHSVLLFGAIVVSVCVDFLTRGLILAIRHGNRWRGEPPEIRAANRADDSPEIAGNSPLLTRSICIPKGKHDKIFSVKYPGGLPMMRRMPVHKKERISKELKKRTGIHLVRGSQEQFRRGPSRFFPCAL